MPIMCPSPGPGARFSDSSIDPTQAAVATSPANKSQRVDGDGQRNTATFEGPDPVQRIVSIGTSHLFGYLCPYLSRQTCARFV